MHHATKVASWWHVDRMIIFLLDSDAAVGTNIKTVEAIGTSLSKMDSSIDTL